MYMTRPCQQVEAVSLALREAAGAGHTDCLRLLIEGVDNINVDFARVRLFLVIMLFNSICSKRSH